MPEYETGGYGNTPPVLSAPWEPDARVHPKGRHGVNAVGRKKVPKNFNFLEMFEQQLQIRVVCRREASVQH